MQWENARDKMPHMQRAVVAVKHKSFTKLYRNSGQYRRVQGAAHADESNGSQLPAPLTNFLDM